MSTTGINELYICGSIIYFKDGNPVEITVLHEGTKEDCDFVCANTHAIAYSGNRQFDHAQCFVMKIEAAGDRPSQQETEL